MKDLIDRVEDAVGNSNLVHEVIEEGDAVKVTYNFGAKVDLKGIGTLEPMKMAVENGRATVTYAKDSYPARD